MNTFYAPTIGGVEKAIQELAERYVQGGYEVDVYCCDSDKHSRISKKEEVINGVKVHRSRYWFRLSLNTFVFPGVIWKLLLGKYDLIHSNVSAHDHVLFAGLVAFLRRKPHIHTTHCPWTDKFRPLSVRIPLFFANNIVNYVSFFFCTKIIAITPWEIPILKKWVSEKKIVVIHNGMDKMLFQPIKNNTFKKDYGIKEKNIVLFFGRFHPTKAPHVLAEVACEVAKEREDIAFVFIGPDEGEFDRVKTMLHDIPHTYISGAIRDKNVIASMYQSANVYVLPSYREGLPLTLFEAMASGRPIVATPCNGVPYEMKDPENGFFVEYGDVAKLKKRILELVDDPQLAKEIGERNRKKAEAYTWDIVVKKTFQVYEDSLYKK